MPTRDLGLTYLEAAHGVQSAVRYEMTQLGFADDAQDKVVSMLKHVRVGVDMRASDAGGLAELLMSKGIITHKEYLESLRVAANEELDRLEQHLRREYDLPDGASFR